MSRLTAENIIKTYGNKEVLHGVDLELESGKIYGLIGRNGAGKTTLLSIMTAQNPATFFPHWDKEMAADLIREFNLDVKKKISKLSKGMLSMVTIVVAMASKAEFTFLDEPVAGLDVVAREKFYRLLLEEFTETGRTFVVSTHIIEEAQDVFEEVIIVDKGQILLKENTQELLERCFHVSGHVIFFVTVQYLHSYDSQTI